MNRYNDKGKLNKVNKSIFLCLQFKRKTFEEKKCTSIVPIEYRMMQRLKNECKFMFYSKRVYIVLTGK